MKTKTLKLNEIKIESFKTSLNNNDKLTINGGEEIVDANAGTKRGFLCLLKKVLPPPVCTHNPLPRKSCAWPANID